MKNLIQYSVVLALLTVFSIICFVMTVVSSYGDSIDVYAVADSAVTLAYPDDNWGDSTRIYAGTYAESQLESTYRSYIRYDLLDIPPNVEVLSVTWNIYFEFCNNYYNHYYYLYRVSEQWDEYTITYANQPNADFQTPMLKYFCGTVQDYWFSQELDLYGLEVVQGWIDGSLDNYGFLWMREEDGVFDNQRTVAYSRECYITSQHYLTIEYTMTSIQPASISFIKAMFQ